MTFAAFMEMALYGPEGYYATGQPSLDYYTGPAAHPTFGALLGLQLDQMWRLLGCSHPFTVVEIGGGRGLLARDILNSPFQPSSLQAIRYLFLERGCISPLSDAPAQAIQGQGVPLKGVTGCFLANELWDAFPEHRVMMRERKLCEVYVALERGHLVEVYDEPSTLELQFYLDREGISLADGQETEINLGLSHHLGEVARALERGFFLSIDYGYLAHERSLHSRGSLRCYYRHQVHADPYVRVGEQDITCSVDFTAAVRAAQRAGFTILGLIPQGPFLQNLGLDVILERLASSGLPSPQYYAEAMGLQELARPGEMGGFYVLIMGKGVEGVELDCFHRDNPTIGGLETLKGALPLPRLRSEHAPLLQARYPHLAWTPPEDAS